jgi:pseudaminic acid biosynthesis-associated methylase
MSTRPCDLCETVAQQAEQFHSAPPPGAAILKSIDTGVDLWAGDFGNDYTERNQVDWTERISFWAKILAGTSARSCFEMGCNAGWNLSAIRHIDHRITVAGNDINTRACQQAWTAGLDKVWNTLNFTPLFPVQAELVFTAGVLIHIEPEFLEEVMKALVAKSYRWVLAIEYNSVHERQIEYRGHKDKCWARPYGLLYQDLGLKIQDSGEAEGFDQCHYWLMEK